LADLFNVRNSEYQNLFQQVLHEDDPQQIEELFTKYGVAPCEDEKKFSEVQVDVSSAKEQEQTEAETIRPSRANTEKKAAISVTKPAKLQEHGGHLVNKSDRAPTDSRAKDAAKSLAPLEHDARSALRGSVKKALATRTVPAKKQNGANTSNSGNGSEHRPRLTQLVDSTDAVGHFAEDREVGVLGEYFTYSTLKQVLKDDFDYENWTSELRHIACPRFPSWEPDPGEEDASDFTYFDEDKTLLKWLLSIGVELPDIWQKESLNFHIEVKATTHSCDEVFHLSRLQKVKAEELTAPTDGSIPEDIFLIFRVYNLSTDVDAQTNFQIYVDPCKMFEEGTLECAAEGWLVCPA
jgi:hypothetical protein